MPSQFTRLDRVDLHARCNDGSPGAFFYAPPTQNIPVWHVHLEGGGSCYDEDTCLSVTHDKSLMSSKHLPQHIWLRGIFSRDLDTGATPALVDAGHAFLKYCSSDSWLGNSSQVWRGSPFFFHGAAILVEAVNALLARGMNKAKLVLFSGCSAGGRGALYNLDGLCKMVRSASPSVRCFGLGDAAWWMDSVFLPHGEFQSALRQTAAHARQVWGGSWISQPLWRCRQQMGTRSLTFPTEGSLATWSPNITHFDRCMFGPALAEHLETPTMLAISLNDWFQFDYLAKNYHSIYFGGPHGGPLSQVDLQMMGALREEFQGSLKKWIQGSPEEPMRMVFASGCFGHCITEGPMFGSLRLREGPGKGLSLSEVLSSFLQGHLTESQEFMEQCQCDTLNCSHGCVPRDLWKVALTMASKYALIPLCLMCGLSLLWCRRKKTTPAGE